MMLRPFQTEDTQGIIDLIDVFFRQHDFQVFLEECDAGLLDIPNEYPGENFMVLVDEDNAVRGTVAITLIPDREGVSEIHRMYLDASLHGTGEAKRLLDWALDRSRELGCNRVELWSDTRFTRAHQFYEKHGFVHDGRVRHIHYSYDQYDERFYALKLSAHSVEG